MPLSANGGTLCNTKILFANFIIAFLLHNSISQFF